MILRKIIPWQSIINKLIQFYNIKKGAFGINLRTVIALLLVSKLRNLSDRKLIEQVQENRYIQYFCNVADEDIFTFIHHSSLTKLRKRYGEKGTEIIQCEILKYLKKMGVMADNKMLIDTTVLNSKIAYPTDIGLLKSAMDKMRTFSKHNKIDPWWDDKELKRVWREYNLNKTKGGFEIYFLTFSVIFYQSFERFKELLAQFPEVEREKYNKLLDTLSTLLDQNEQKLNGEKHIKDRLVSLHETDARPITKGKKHPSTEFGTKNQLIFNRQGFMIGSQVYIGNPSDKSLYPDALKHFEKFMKTPPDLSVTDAGYRCKSNIKIAEKTKGKFFGLSTDVDESIKNECKSARSATEGYIATAKNLYGFRYSLYSGLIGDKIWSYLSQAAYNLRKFIRLYDEEEISEFSLKKMGLLA